MSEPLSTAGEYKLSMTITCKGVGDKITAQFSVQHWYETPEEMEEALQRVLANTPSHIMRQVREKALAEEAARRET